jgi:hypothetical protein
MTQNNWKTSDAKPIPLEASRKRAHRSFSAFASFLVYGLGQPDGHATANSERRQLLRFFPPGGPGLATHKRTGASRLVFEALELGDSVLLSRPPRKERH